ncbi:hypothetical protein BEL04_14595 [Mucilaginibacter sp. PPCGB 2223]|uniref:hypothetical protein n=1 Tax=Mucilaginibacter sp. PPCGB 2223 TaxID=1886027 RepID=UPI00082477C4|nr:hypothetical protein [Mucilaginibacter sp. PPCGB 2223]OCX52672.1 hypothetical protein BEL04_14595 [Mucilaginibacter sp. PPCGB 2223]
MTTELLNYFNAVKQQIIDAATQRGMSASGKTLGSLQVIETPNGYELEANSSIYFLEHGRGPTTVPKGDHGNPDLVGIIRDWISAKGLDLNPYAVANTIHKSGTRLYRAGGNSGVLSVPLNLDTLDQVFDQIAGQYLQKTADEIFKTLAPS